MYGVNSSSPQYEHAVSEEMGAGMRGGGVAIPTIRVAAIIAVVAAILGVLSIVFDVGSEKSSGPSGEASVTTNAGD